MEQLICKDVSLGYGGSVVSEHVSFAVRKGDYLCIVGENGSGKSTLMKVLLGLMEPLGGQVMWGEGSRPCDIGYLPQRTEAQADFPASVWEVVLSGCVGRSDFRFWAGKEHRRRAEACLKRLEITELKNRSFRCLSGGQRQRVLLARALCAAEKVLLLDEPTAGLDPHAAADFYETVRQLNREEGMTVIMVTHDPAAVRSYADCVLHMGNSSTFFSAEEELCRRWGAEGEREEDHD